jgi:hypothetical protein
VTVKPVRVRKPKAEVRRTRDTWKAAPLTFNGIQAAVDRARSRLQHNPAFISELERRGSERALV